MGQLFCRCRPHRRRIVSRHGLENFVANPGKRNEPDPLLESHLRDLFPVFQRIQLFLNQSFAGSPFACQHFVVVRVVAHVIVKQQQRIRRGQNHAWLGVPQRFFEIALRVFRAHRAQRMGRRPPHIGLLVL